MPDVTRDSVLGTVVLEIVDLLGVQAKGTVDLRHVRLGVAADDPEAA